MNYEKTSVIERKFLFKTIPPDGDCSYSVAGGEIISGFAPVREGAGVNDSIVRLGVAVSASEDEFLSAEGMEV